MVIVHSEKNCYNSSILVMHRYDHGYHNVLCIDYSESVIATMNQRKGGRKTLVYQVMDATNMKFADGEFDVVIDKVVCLCKTLILGMLRCYLCRRQRKMQIGCHKVPGRNHSCSSS